MTTSARQPTTSNRTHTHTQTHIRVDVDEVVHLPRVSLDVEEVVRVAARRAALGAVAAGVAVAGEGAVRQGVVGEGVLVERVPPRAPHVGEELVLARAERSLRELRFLGEAGGREGAFERNSFVSGAERRA